MFSSISATLENEKVIIRGLEDISRKAPEALSEGIFEAGQEVLKETLLLLSGPGRKKVSSKTRARGQFDMIGARPGSYPIPVISGNLRRLEDIVAPGKSMTLNDVTITAGKLETIIFNSSRYGNVIYEGTGSSAKYGARPFHDDAVKKVDIVGIIEKKIARITK